VAGTCGDHHGHNAAFPLRRHELPVTGIRGAPPDHRRTACPTHGPTGRDPMPCRSCARWRRGRTAGAMPRPAGERANVAQAGSAQRTVFAELASACHRHRRQGLAPWASLWVHCLRSGTPARRRSATRSDRDHGAGLAGGASRHRSDRARPRWCLRRGGGKHLPWHPAGGRSLASNGERQRRAARRRPPLDATGSSRPRSRDGRAQCADQRRAAPARGGSFAARRPRPPSGEWWKPADRSKR
jgi:hypothetical protein